MANELSQGPEHQASYHSEGVQHGQGQRPKLLIHYSHKDFETSIFGRLAASKLFNCSRRSMLTSSRATLSQICTHTACYPFSWFTRISDSAFFHLTCKRMLGALVVRKRGCHSRRSARAVSREPRRPCDSSRGHPKSDTVDLMAGAAQIASRTCTYIYIYIRTPKKITYGK